MIGFPPEDIAKMRMGIPVTRYIGLLDINRQEPPWGLYTRKEVGLTLENRTIYINDACEFSTDDKFLCYYMGIFSAECSCHGDLLYEEAMGARHIIGGAKCTLTIYPGYFIEFKYE